MPKRYDVTHHCGPCSKLSKKKTVMGFCEEHSIFCTVHTDWYHGKTELCGWCERDKERKATAERKEKEAAEKKKKSDEDKAWYQGK
jgi:hypothetical protein